MNGLEAIPDPKWFERTCNICKSHGVVMFWHWRTRHSCRLKRSWARYDRLPPLKSFESRHSEYSAEVLFGLNYLNNQLGPNFLLRVHHVSCFTSIVQQAGSRWRHVACNQLQQRLRNTPGVAGRTAGTAAGPAREATRYSGRLLRSLRFLRSLETGESSDEFCVRLLLTAEVVPASARLRTPLSASRTMNSTRLNSGSSTWLVRKNVQQSTMHRRHSWMVFLTGFLQPE